MEGGVLRPLQEAHEGHIQNVDGTVIGCFVEKNKGESALPMLVEDGTRDLFGRHCSKEEEDK
ncbi:hypothetical protein ACLOJK_007928, partial [Asimina triloba]